MKQKIEIALDQARGFTAANLTELENFRVEYLGKKGIVQELFTQFKSLPAPDKKETGVLLNELKKQYRRRLIYL